MSGSARDLARIRMYDINDRFGAAGGLAMNMLLVHGGYLSLHVPDVHAHHEHPMVYPPVGALLEGVELRCIKTLGFKAPDASTGHWS